MKEQVARGFLSSLGIKVPILKDVPGLDILF